MTAFLEPDFLLDTPAAQRLYHDVAADLPIVDCHNKNLSQIFRNVQAGRIEWCEVDRIDQEWAMSAPFKGAHFPKDVILHVVFFHLRCGVSYRDFEEIMA